MAHEVSVTFRTKGGRWGNFKSMHGGKRLSQGTLERWVSEGRLKPLGGKTFSTAGEATAAAKDRSSSFDAKMKVLEER